MSRLFSSFARDTRGAAAAEMALVLPFLMVLMFGGMEAGHYYWTEHKVLKAVRDGVRFAARQNFSAYTCSTVDETTRAKVSLLTRTGQLDAANDTDQYRKVPGWADGTGASASLLQVSVACNTATTGGIYISQTGGAPVVTVSAVVPYPSLFAGLGIINSSAYLKATARSAVAGI